MSSPGQSTSDLITTLPTSHRVLRIRFGEETSGSEVLFPFPAPLKLVAEAMNPQDQGAEPHYELLTLPVDLADSEDDQDQSGFSAAEQWVQSGSPEPPTVMSFQGVRICRTSVRCAVLAPSDRLPSVRDAVLETTWYERELRSIEEEVASGWDGLKADLDMAFEFSERQLPRRQQLKNRGMAMLLCQARLARIGTFVHSPHVYPPTTGSQVSERLRERTRLMHRHEFLAEELEVYRGLYEMCGQRANDYVLTRSGNILEWIIIILLVVQTLFSVVDYLGSVE